MKCEKMYRLCRKESGSKMDGEKCVKDLEIPTKI